MFALLLIVAFLLLFPLTLLILAPFGFALTSIGNLLTLPGQMIRVAVDGRRRRNHSLEHATVNVLEERYQTRMPLGGFAEQDGFFIHGPAQPDAVLSAAREGLERLKAGEEELALHARCGTMIVAGELISAISFVVILLLLPGPTFFKLFFAMIMALLAARALAEPVGLFLQRAVTTSGNVQGLHVDRLEATMPKHPFALVLSGGRPTRFRIWTTEVSVEASTTKRFKAY